MTTFSLRTFIVDDEAPARRELRYLLERVADVEVVGEAGNATAALAGIRETSPHLVFLDIQMPGLSGLELARFLDLLPVRPLLVFATAFDEYAAEAFDVEAVDYLLKPFSEERLVRAVAKARRALAVVSPLRPAGGRQPTEICRKVPLYRGDTIVPTAIDRIVFARAEGGEVYVHAVDGRYRARLTLGELEQKLASSGFIRTHRSFLVNIDHVREVIPWFHGSYKLVMDDRERTEIPVSRYNVKDLKKHFDL